MDNSQHCSLPCARGGGSRRLTEGLYAGIFAKNLRMIFLLTHFETQGTTPQSLRDSSPYTGELALLGDAIVPFINNPSLGLELNSPMMI